VDWLRELSAEEIETLRRASVCRDYAPGATIFAPASHPHSLYLMERGLARVYRLSEEGSETTFGYIAPGEVFGELAAFGDYPRESYAQAARPSRVWKIPRDVFRKMLEARPDLVLEVTRQIGTRFKRIESRVENLVFRDARARIAQILLELGRDFGRHDDGSTEIEIDFTQTELATLVGTTRQAVNATLRNFEQEGLIRRVARHLILRREEALRGIVEGSEPD
jgi:CRP-like cAMP-binding protein